MPAAPTVQVVLIAGLGGRGSPLSGLPASALAAPALLLSVHRLHSDPLQTEVRPCHPPASSARLPSHLGHKQAASTARRAPRGPAPLPVPPTVLPQTPALLPLRHAQAQSPCARCPFGWKALLPDLSMGFFPFSSDLFKYHFIKRPSCLGQHPDMALSFSVARSTT